MIDPAAVALLSRAATLNAILEVLLDIAIEQMAARGGPTEADYAYSRDVGMRLAGSGDALQFGGGTAERKPAGSGQVAKALAPQAWAPGGLTINGREWRR